MNLHDRMTTLEIEARARIGKALSAGNEKLLEIDRALSRVDKEDWSVPGMRRQLEDLRARAEKTIKRAGDLPGEAMSKLASGTRAPIQNLARGLAEMAKKVEPPAERPGATTAASRPVVPKPPRPARRAEAEAQAAADE